MVAPFVWMVLSSLKDFTEMFVVPPRWLPADPQWNNYPESWTALPFGRAYLNSFLVASTVTAATLLTCSMAGYAFAKLRFPLSNVLFVAFLATMMVPQQVTIMPLYLLMRSLGLIDSLLAIIVPFSLFNAFGVFLMRQFIKGIPRELEEAALIDGAGYWTVYWRIILPLTKAPLAALGIFTFLFQWNNFFHPLIFLNSTEKFTVPLLLNQFKGQYITDYTLMLAGSAIAIVPVLIVYVMGQRYIIEGVSVTGLKR